MRLIPAFVARPERNCVYHCDWRVLLGALDDHSVDMILTDMPYGTTACSWDAVIDLDAWWVEAHRVAKPRAAIVCTGSQPFTTTLIASNIKRFKYSWVWDKGIGRGHLVAKYRPMQQTEDIMIFGNGRIQYFPQMEPLKTPRFSKEVTRTSIMRGKRSDTYEWKLLTEAHPVNVLYFQPVPTPVVKHPTQKPVALFEYLIRTYTQPGDLVLDPFVGSGTTALAARACGRDFVCGDMLLEYVEIARDRLRLPFEPRQAQQDTRLDDLPLFSGLNK